MQRREWVAQTENEKLQWKAQVEELQGQVKQVKKFEYMYEEEKFAKIEMGNHIAMLEAKVDEYKKQADRMEHQVNKKERELD